MNREYHLGEKVPEGLIKMWRLEMPAHLAASDSKYRLQHNILRGDEAQLGGPKTGLVSKLSGK